MPLDFYNPPLKIFSSSGTKKGIEIGGAKSIISIDSNHNFYNEGNIYTEMSWAAFYEEEGLEDVIENFSDLIIRGFEGSMHRYAADPYMWTGDKRTDRLIKKKSIRQATVMCIGTIPHANQYKGITGSLIYRGIVNDKIAGTVEVEGNVGSGLSKFDIQFGEERYIGKEIELLYNSITESDGKHSLFLPMYKRIVGDA